MESHDQEKAQYGRLLPDATDYIFRKVLDLKKEDVFVDIGHGIGNSVLQAAFTIGCESRGIELIKYRNSVATDFQKNLEQQLFAEDDRKVGEVFLREGRLEDETHRVFLANPEIAGTGCVKALANNFNGVFADRCYTSKQVYFLDNYIAALFAEMKPGSMLVTLHPLLDLPLSFSGVTERRKRHNLKKCDENASFYQVRKFIIGKANECVSWSAHGSNRHDITVYRYERLEQKSNRAVFLCTNPDCREAKRGIPIQATKKVTFDTISGNEVRVVINHCVCNNSGKVLRQREEGSSHSK